MKLLLHACCADCALKFAHSLDLKMSKFAVLYYNPNIHPKAEYLERLKALKLVCQKLKA